MDITKYRDYRKFVQDKIKSYPQNGYGIQSKLCQAAGIFTSYMAGVLKGEKQFTPEQAVAIADFFQLNPAESDYFIELVQLDRAGTDRLRKYHLEKIQNLKEKLSRVKDRQQPEKELISEAQATFYSDWRYSAIRNACALPKMTPPRIATLLELNIAQVHRILEFLLKNGLVVKEKDHLKVGPTFTRIRAGDPLVYRHHANWRLKAIDSFSDENEEHMHVTAPLSLSAKDALIIKEMLYKNVGKILDVVEPSESEELWCVNMDWFKLG